MREWVANWKRTGEELDRRKWEELQTMDESMSAIIFNRLGSGWVEEWQSPARDREAGLVVQQEYFSKAHAAQRHS